MYEIICYNAQGAAFHRIISDTMDTAELMAVIPAETFGVLIHDAATGHYVGRA